MIEIQFSKIELIYKSNMNRPVRWLSSATGSARPLQRPRFRHFLAPLAALCLLLVALLIDAHSPTDKANDQGRLLAGQARQIAAAMNTTLERHVLELQSHAAWLNTLTHHNRHEHLADWFRIMHNHPSDYGWIGFADSAGTVQAASNTLAIGTSALNHTWFWRGVENAMAADAHSAVALTVTEEGSRPEAMRPIDLAIPVRNHDRQFLGVLVAQLKPDWLGLQMQRLDASSHPSGATDVVIADKEGRVRLASPTVGQHDLTLLRSFRQARNGNHGWIRETWPDGRDYLVGFTPVGNHSNALVDGWIAMMRLPADIAAATGETRTDAASILIAGSAVLIMLGASLLSMDILRSPRATDLARTRFLADLSHEVRTSLQGLISLASALRDRLLVPTNRHDADQLIRCGNELRALMDDLLDLASIDEGRLRLHMGPVAVVDAVRFNARLFEPLACAGLRWQVHILIDEQTMVLADPVRLGQILRNLLSNAVKFTQQGSIRITVTTKDRNPSGEKSSWVEIIVEDTGTGMSQSEQALVFGRFIRGASNPLSSIGGHGLGLSLTHALVQAMGGELSLQSRKGIGSRFCVRLRTCDPTTPEAPAPCNQSVTSMDDMRRLTVLVVDDMDTHRTALQRWLDMQGHDAWEADSGGKAIRLAASRYFDLILLDIRLPDMCGRDVARTIRSSGGLSSASPIFAITGHGFIEDIAQSRAAGIDVHLIKPLDLSELSHRLSGIGAATTRTHQSNATARTPASDC